MAATANIVNSPVHDQHVACGFCGVRYFERHICVTPRPARGVSSLDALLEDDLDHRNLLENPRDRRYGVRLEEGFAMLAMGGRTIDDLVEA